METVTKMSELKSKLVRLNSNTLTKKMREEFTPREKRVASKILEERGKFKTEMPKPAEALVVDTERQRIEKIVTEVFDSLVEKFLAENSLKSEKPSLKVKKGSNIDFFKSTEVPGLALNSKVSFTVSQISKKHKGEKITGHVSRIFISANSDKEFCRIKTSVGVFFKRSLSLTVVK